MRWDGMELCGEINIHTVVFRAGLENFLRFFVHTYPLFSLTMYIQTPKFTSSSLSTRSCLSHLSFLHLPYLTLPIPQDLNIPSAYSPSNLISQSSCRERFGWGLLREGFGGGGWLVYGGFSFLLWMFLDVGGGGCLGIWIWIISSAAVFGFRSRMIWGAWAAEVEVERGLWIVLYMCLRCASSFFGR